MRSVNNLLLFCDSLSNNQNLLTLEEQNLIINRINLRIEILQEQALNRANTMHNYNLRPRN